MTSDDDRKKQISRLRDGAYSFELPETGGFEELVQLDDELVVLGRNGVFRFRHADKTDPERINIDVPNTTQCVFPFDDKYTFSQWIFRTAVSLFGKENNLREGIDVKEVLSISTSIARDFWDIEYHLKRLIDLEEAEQGAFYQRAIQKNTIHLPSAPDYRPAFTGFLIKSSHIWRDLLEIIKICFEIKKSKFRYDHLIKYAAENYGENDILYQFASDSLYQLTFIKEARNALEHPDESMSVTFRDYQLQEDNSVFLPAVKIVHPKTPHDFVSASMLMEKMLDNLAYIVEGFLTMCCTYNAGTIGSFRHAIEEIDGRSDQHVLERYRWVVVPQESAE